MNRLLPISLLCILALTALPGRGADETDPLTPWRSGVKVHPVSPLTDRHVINSYFNTCPESPDGRYVLYYTSGTPEGESGDLRVLERATGVETIVATNINTEDAHRAACQQWLQGGKTIAYHDCREGRWCVVALDLATKTEKILAQDHQIGFGAPMGDWVPIYGCHWNPGAYRDLELVNVVTGEKRTVVTAAAVVQKYSEWMQAKFGTTDISVFFPVMSPDGKKVFFKPNHPSYRSGFRGMDSSARDGNVVFDLEKGELVRLIGEWGHPSWTPDSRGIMEKGNGVLNLETGVTARRFAPSCFSDHPSMSPDGRLFVTDGDVSKRPFGKPGFWGIATGPTKGDEFVVVHLFDNSHGATSWRHNHPHPSFSADGHRIYFNINADQWTQLLVAECAEPAPAQK